MSRSRPTRAWRGNGGTLGAPAPRRPTVGIRWARAAGLLALVAATSAVGGIAASASPASDRAIARQIDLRSADLPAGTQWTSTSAAVDTPSQTAEARKGVACIQRAVGPKLSVSPDPFGITGSPGGDVTADVQSPIFSPKGVADGLPSASSDVVMTTTSAQAAADLRALGTPGGLSCVQTVVRALLTAAGLSTAKVTVAALKAPRLPSVPAGIGYSFTLAAPSVGSLTGDTFLYVAGRAELSLEYESTKKPFDPAWILAISEKVAARASALVGQRTVALPNPAEARTLHKEVRGDDR